MDREPPSKKLKSSHDGAQSWDDTPDLETRSCLWESYNLEVGDRSCPQKTQRKRPLTPPLSDVEVSQLAPLAQVERPKKKVLLKAPREGGLLPSPGMPPKRGLLPRPGRGSRIHAPMRARPPLLAGEKEGLLPLPHSSRGLLPYPQQQQVFLNKKQGLLPHPVFCNSQHQQQQPMHQSLPPPQPMLQSIPPQPLLQSLPQQQPLLQSLSQQQPLLQSIPQQQPLLQSIPQQQPLLKSIPQQQPMLQTLSQQQPLLQSLPQQQPLLPSIPQQPLLQSIPQQQPLLQSHPQQQPMLQSQPLFQSIPPPNPRPNEPENKGLLPTPSSQPSARTIPPGLLPHPSRPALLPTPPRSQGLPPGLPIRS